MFKVKCVAVRGVGYDLTEGKVYDVVDMAEGIFPTSPYVVVINNAGERSAFHHYRFEVNDTEVKQGINGQVYYGA